MKTLPAGMECDVVIEEMAPGDLDGLLDRDARAVLGISGAEFAEKWAAGHYLHADDPRITDLAILLP